MHYALPVDKSCHSGLTCRSTRHEINSEGIVVSFYHALHATRLIQEEVVFVFICNGKAEEAERLV